MGVRLGIGLGFEFGMGPLLSGVSTSGIFWCEYSSKDTHFDGIDP